MAGEDRSKTLEVGQKANSQRHITRRSPFRKVRPLTPLQMSSHAARQAASDTENLHFAGLSLSRCKQSKLFAVFATPPPSTLSHTLRPPRLLSSTIHHHTSAVCTVQLFGPQQKSKTLSKGANCSNLFNSPWIQPTAPLPTMATTAHKMTSMVSLSISKEQAAPAFYISLLPLSTLVLAR